MKRAVLAAALLLSLLSLFTAKAETLKNGELKTVTLPAQLEIRPEVNGEYEVSVFPGDTQVAVEVLEDGEAVGGTQVRLTRYTDYTVRLEGEGEVRVELARQTLGRCASQPLELNDGDRYSKMISRSGDAHWYSFTAQTDGAALLALNAEAFLEPEAELMNDAGQSVAQTEFLPGGTAVLSAEVHAGMQYRIRVHGAAGQTGTYGLCLLRSSNAQAAQSVEMARQVVLDGRERRYLQPRLYPMDSCGLVWFESTDPEVADVDGYGTVFSYRKGRTELTLYAYGGVRASTQAEVRAVEAEGVLFEGGSVTINRGEDVQLTWKMIPENATSTDVTFRTTDDSVAAVDESGLLHAVGEGAAVITIEAERGSDILYIEVLPPVTRYRALLIGEETYAKGVDDDRPGTVKTMADVAALFASQQFGQSVYDVETRIDVSRDEALAAMKETFRDARIWDVSLIYLSCHGFCMDGMSFMLMSDGSVLSAADLARALAGIRGRIILLADCCGSGALTGMEKRFADGLTGAFDEAGTSPFSGGRIFVMASAAPGEDSHRMRFEDYSTTVFARALCDAGGWSMDRQTTSAMNADVDYDLQVSAAELENYMTKRVRWLLGQAGDYPQTVSVSPKASDLTLFMRVGE